MDDVTRFVLANLNAVVAVLLIVLALILLAIGVSTKRAYDRAREGGWCGDPTRSSGPCRRPLARNRAHCGIPMHGAKVGFGLGPALVLLVLAAAPLLLVPPLGDLLPS